MHNTRQPIVKPFLTATFTLDLSGIKSRQHFAPVRRIHKDKRNTYSRAAFKRGE